MDVVICPGIHHTQLTEKFIEGLQPKLSQLNYLIFPTENYPAYSTFQILEFLRHSLLKTNDLSCASTRPICWISFSAGVAGAIAAAWAWRRAGGSIKAFIALDGWGVPLAGDFPIHRVSHDWFTHWSSALLGRGDSSFYADPPVSHLDLWQSPQTAHGWGVHREQHQTEQRFPTSAADFIATILNQDAVSHQLSPGKTS